MTNALVIAGASSSVGKTTFTTGLIAALRARGRQVQPFKAGPDYLDPTYHSRAATQTYPSRNLDTWLLPAANLQELYYRAAAKADFCLIEGVMGLYDGKNGRSEEGSTAALAKLLDIPVVVVLDIGKLSRTAGAIALGLQKFDPALRLAGFLLNQAGSLTHYEWVKQSIEDATGLPVLGWLPKNQEWALPERHLGLVPAGEGQAASELDNLLDRLSRQLSETVDLLRLEQIAATAGQTAPLAPASVLFPEKPVPSYVRIGLAQDAAFGFYYQDNLDLLQAWGAELVPFSPLADQTLPPNLDGLYLGGGFPEVFAADLAANQAMQVAIRQAAANGLKIYAECGGLMYLCRELTDFEGQKYPMVGLLPYRTFMQNRRVKLGYTEVTAARAGFPLLENGETIRSHEFHWSLLEGDFQPEQAAYTIPAQANRAEGWWHENVLASYLHLHFGNDVRLTSRLLNWYANKK